MSNTLFSQMAQDGFEMVDSSFCVGTWRNYAVTLRHFSGKSYYVYVAIRVESAQNKLRKTIRAAIKTAGVKKCNINQVNKNYLLSTVTFGKEEREENAMRAYLDVLTSALRDAGVAPANTCAVSGAANPDSLCMMMNQAYFGFQPVNAAAVRQSGYEAQAKAEENENNGSYLTGAVGALLGALVGMAANLLLIVLLNRVSAWLFALVPVASMFGYKTLRGKTNKLAVVIVLLACILMVPILEFSAASIELARQYDLPFGEALGYVGERFFEAEVLKEALPDMLRLLLFMGLGLLIGWGYLQNSLNSTKIKSAQAQLDSMRPNPNRQ
ncbi:MAG: hypothetical protein IIY94_07760 [Oscillospiraceae bacterium]|nr:hypothetical protein [Oscillospiraceae bacterium]